MRALRYVLETVLPPLLLLGAVLLVWEVAVRALAIPRYLLPPPSRVAVVAWRDAWQVLGAMHYTLLAAVGGFLISLVLGTIIAMLFAQSRIIRSAGYPYAIFLQTVPIVAIAPLIIAISGQNFRSVVLVAVIISLFPVIANVTAGLLAVDPKLEELFAVLRASRWQRLVKLQIPTAIPHLVTGAKTSSGMAMVGAIVGEFFAGFGGDHFGLGYLFQSTSDNLQTEKLFVALLAAAALGVAIFSAVNLAALGLRRWTRQ